jgi:hypothetical protein
MTVTNLFTNPASTIDIDSFTSPIEPTKAVQLIWNKTLEQFGLVNKWMSQFNQMDKLVMDLDTVHRDRTNIHPCSYLKDKTEAERK